MTRYKGKKGASRAAAGRSAKPVSSSGETILFAVTGMSPAVLTETVWALAHEKPSVIPDRVMVLTTRLGAEAIRRELFDGDPCVWDTLRDQLRAGTRLRFGTTGSDTLLFTARDARSGRSVELDDIRTPADNAAAADFILEHLRRFTENPETRVIASIAGGRKTMGTLLYACMSLIGRETDRLTHVLVNEPYDNPRLSPRFYFPAQKASAICMPGSKPMRAADARIELADLPFVPLRNRFAELGRLPGSFRSLVLQYKKSLDVASATPVRLAFGSGGVVKISGAVVTLSARAHAVLRFLVDLNTKTGLDIPRQNEVEESFRAFLEIHDSEWLKNLVFPDDLKRELSEIRSQFQAEGIDWKPGLRRESLRLPPFRIE